MPHFCCIIGCGNKANKHPGLSFYRLPKIPVRSHIYKELITERRNLWLLRIKRKDTANPDIWRVCGKHFITGAPAALRDRCNPDWAPILNLGYEKYADNAPKAMGSRVRYERSMKRQQYSDKQDALQGLRLYEQEVEEATDPTCNFVDVQETPRDDPLSPSSTVDRGSTYPTPVDPLAECEGMAYDDDVKVKYEPLVDEKLTSAPPHSSESTLAHTPVTRSSPSQPSQDSRGSVKSQSDDDDGNGRKKMKKEGEEDKETMKWHEAETHLTWFLTFAHSSSFYSDAEVAKIHHLLQDLQLKRAAALRATRDEQDSYDTLNNFVPSDVTATETEQSLVDELCGAAERVDSSSCSDSDSEEQHPLDDTLALEECARAAVALSEGSWSSVVPLGNAYPFRGKEELCIRPTPTGSKCLPIEVYSMFVSDKILDSIVQETNKFAAQEMSSLTSSKHSRLRGWQPTNKQEMKRLLGILLYRGTVHYPEPHLYWSKSRLYANTLVSCAMDSDRFQLLCRMLKFSGNRNHASQCETKKVNTFFEQVVYNYKTIYKPGSEVVLEEAVIPLVGRGSSWQDAPGKSVTLLKVCSVDGYTWNCEAYSGQGNTCHGLGPKDSVAARLMFPLLKRGVTLYCDDPYTASVPLAEYLLSHMTYLCGSVDPSHAWLPREVTAARVHNDQVVSLQNEKGVKVFHWNDDKSVLMLSTIPEHDDNIVVADMAARKAQSVRRSRSRVWRGDSECMTNFHKCPRNTNKWNYIVAVELLCGISVVNAWMIYNKYLTDKNLSLLAFKESLILSLLTDSPCKAITPGTIELASMKHHFLVETKERHICVGCYEVLSVMGEKDASRKARKVFTCCQMCVGSPYLCTDCFITEHS